MKDCLEKAAKAASPDESTLKQITGRTCLHLSNIYTAQGVKPEEATELHQNGREILKDYLCNMPEYFAGVDDEMIIMDGIQTEIARYTGRVFLPHMQKWFSTVEGRKTMV